MNATQIDAPSCSGTLNPTTLNVSLLLGGFIVILNTLVGLGMKQFGPKYLQSKKLPKVDLKWFYFQ